MIITTARALVLPVAFSLILLSQNSSAQERCSMSKAFQLFGVVLSDANLVSRDWAKYSIFSTYRKGLKELPFEEQFRLQTMMYEDLASYIAPHKNKLCSSFFEKPKKLRPMTWASRNAAMDIAMYASDPDNTDNWTHRSVQIINHRKGEMRPFTKQAIYLRTQWDKLCFETDMTVQEVAFTMSNSPESTEEPEWDVDKKYMREFERKFINQ